MAGVVDVTDYINTYALNDSWTHFLAGAGIADANGDPTDPGNSLSSFFDTGEYFTHAEISWSPS